MSKFQSPLLGYNNNIRHRGQVFHVQTEDSGVKHPHVITHLFMDGGRILKSVKRPYTEHVGSATMSETVRALMKEQHKAMLIALRDGQFDELIEGAKHPSSTTIANAAHATLTNLTSVAEPAAPWVAPSPAPNADVPSLPRPTEPRASSSAPAVPVARSDSPTRAPVADPSALPPEIEALLREDPPAPPEEPHPRPSPQELTLDFDALGRAGDDGSLSPRYRQTDLPPPPKSLFAKTAGVGAYRSGDAVEAEQNSIVTHRPPSAGAASTGARLLAATAPPPSAYAPGPTTAPAAEEPRAKQPTAPSLFRGERIGDRSLDEVILSYLAEDLEPPARK